MKHMRKLVTLVIVLAMVMAFMVPTAMAATNDGKITVENAVVGQTYNIYRIFDLKYSETNGNTTYAYTISEKWTGFFADAADGAAYIGENVTEYPIIVNNTTKYIQITNDNADDFAVAAREYIADNAITNDGTNVASTTSVVFENLAYGYYLLDTTTGTLCSLDSAAKEVKINDKSTAPTIEKTVDKTTASIGDSLTYTIKIKVGAGAQNYVLSDVLPDGVVVPTTVTVNGVTGVSAVIDDADQKITVDFTNVTLTKDQEITISYTTTLDADAEIAGENKNTATLTYGENKDLTVSDDANIYTYSFDLVKTNGTTKLDGATFKMYDAEIDGNEILVVKVTDGVYRKAVTGETGVNIEAGKVTIQGLANGTYYLEEIEAPEGYNKLTERVAVTITNANNSATMNGDTYTSGGVEVENKSGSVLPSTGGMGTTIFYILGSLMVVGAAVVLVTNKRMRGQM